jgi:hypothetical protein
MESLEEYVVSYNKTDWGKPLLQGSRVDEMTKYRRKYLTAVCDPSQLANVSVVILAYRGKDPDPRWIDVEPGEHIGIGVKPHAIDHR